MKRRRFATLLLFAAALAGCDAPTLQPAPTAKKPTAATPTIVASFHDDFAAAADLAAREQQPLLLFFTADWCAYCRQIRQDVFARPDVAEAAKRFVCVEIDAGKNPALAEEYRVRAYPTIVLASPSGKAIERIVGVTTPTVVLTHLNATATAVVAAREQAAPATIAR